MWLYDLDEDKAVIVLDKELSVEEKRYVLLHELLHAIHEIMDVGVTEYPEDVRPPRSQS